MKGKNNNKNRRAAMRIRKSIFAIIAFTFITGISGYFGSFLTSAHGNPDEEICYISIEIQPGDTLWSIAEEYMPDEYGSIEAYIKELKELNSLVTSDIQAEHHLLVTVYKNTI